MVNPVESASRLPSRNTFLMERNQILKKRLISVLGHNSLEHLILSNTEEALNDSYHPDEMTQETKRYSWARKRAIWD